jgi:hypothetical protein
MKRPPPNPTLGRLVEALQDCAALARGALNQQQDHRRALAEVGKVVARILEEPAR